MNEFQHQLWGYQIKLPDTWHHQRFGHKDGFSADRDAFLPDYQGDILAQLLINGEWNARRQPVFELWQRHLGKISLMLGAKNVSSAPWEMAGAQGYEVEIVLPKKNRRRLWTGILENGMLILTFLVLHWKDNRGEMEPLLSEIISSLQFLTGIDDLATNKEGFPLPDPAQEIDPLQVISDIADLENWQAYQTDYPIGSLQAFYLRELPRLGWEISRYVPYPNSGNHPFARIIMQKAGREYSLGLLPDPDGNLAGKIVLKGEPAGKPDSRA